ncbi:MAG: hypothetical protein ACOYMR_05605 [Ilumatobacteraceae bacterium]
MRWSPRRGLALLAALGIAMTALGGAVTANALAPANDNYADRIVIAKDTPIDVNFAEATIEPVIDAEAGLAACGLDTVAIFPNMRTVWFDFTPTVAEVVEMSIAGPGSLGTAAVIGDPGAFSGVACSQSGSLIFDVEPGVTYRLAAADLAGIGGTATITVASAPPPPTISATLDGTGTVDVVNNRVAVSGTYTCTSAVPVAYVEVVGRVQQTSGRFYVSDFFSGTAAPATCDGTAQPWSGETALGPNGLFRPGPVSVEVYSITAFNGRSANTAIPTATIRVKGVNGTPAPLPPPPSATPMTFTVDRAPVLDRATNVVTVSGTFSCSGGDQAYASGKLRQVANNGIFIDAFLSIGLGQCTGSTQRWTATVTPFSLIPDAFSGGAATVDATAFSCSVDACGNDTAVVVPVTIKAVGQKGKKSTVVNALPAGVAVNFDRSAVLDVATNTVTVSGTVACSRDTFVYLVDNEVGQLVGRVNVRGEDSPFTELSCGGVPQRFSFQLVASNGRFLPGKAVVSSYMFFTTIDPEGFVDGDTGIAQADVRLVTLKTTK